jgi:EmrB/QacA subfamily drug resistance transporter
METSARTIQERVVLLVYVIGLYMSALDTTIVNTALPSITRDFHATLASAQWVVLGYLLSLAVCIPCSGWLGDRFGTKRVYLLSLFVFTGASVMCGLAPTLNQLIVFRVIQGLGGGLLAPVGQAMLFRTFGPARRARVAGIVALGTSLGPLTGPVLGGILVTTLSWRWCFYVNVPFGVVALVVGILFLAEHREPVPGEFDIPGFILAGMGLALFLYAISEAPTAGWTSPTVITTGSVGLAALAGLVFVELHKQNPMLNLRLLNDRLFRITTLVGFVGMAAFFGNLFLVPQFLQNVRGASALSSGLTTFPGSLGLLVTSQIAARVYPSVGPRRLVVAGQAGATTILLIFGFGVGLATSTWTIRALAFLNGCCLAFVTIPIQASSFTTISSSDTGRASALFTTQQRVSGGVGVAIIATVIASSVHLSPGTTGPDLLHAYHNAFLAAAALLLAGALLALRIHDSDAAPTMRRRADAPVAEENLDGTLADLPARASTRRQQVEE